jgi:hypothetical protein
MSGKLIKNADKAIINHKESYLSRIDDIINTVKKLKTENNWIADGNHKMTVMPWSDFYKICTEMDTI